MNEENPTYDQLQIKLKELESELAERNDEKFKFLADNSIDCLWQLDKRLKFIYLSPALYHMTGFKPEEWVGTHLWTHFKRREFIGVGRLAIKMLRQYKTFGYVTFTTKMINKANEEFPVEIISKPMVDKNGKLVGLQGTTREISERVEYQRELERVNTELKKINKELNSKLNEINEINSQLLISKNKAQESERLKSAFLANMSHEIRTPMNGILGFISLLKESNITIEEQSKYYEIIQKSSHRLLTTINDIVDISMIESGNTKVVHKPISLDNMLNEIYEFFLPESTLKNLSLKLIKETASSNKPFVSDEHLIQSVLNNLIKNALKFTHQGAIEILYKYDGNILSFEVKDTGIGIPKERLIAIFNRFEKADIEDTKVFEGSGLGLAITKSYVELLDGSIEVNSIKGHGTSFFVNIPSKNAFLENKEKQVLQNKHSNFNKKPVILIAEDDEASFEYLNTILSNLSKKIYWAKDGRTAVEMAVENHTIDIILIDIKMPVMNGFEALKKIKESKIKVPIIAQTAFVYENEVKKIFDAGFDDYISKPIDRIVLIEKLIKLGI